MKYIISIVVFSGMLISCKTHFIQTKIKAPLQPQVVGVAVQLNEAADTTTISKELHEYLQDCKFEPLAELFKKQIYIKENYTRLWNADSAFIFQQPGLKYLPQMLICKLEFIQKTDEITAKTNVWISFTGRWIRLQPLKKIHDFYYVEKIGYSGTPQDYSMLVSFLAAQMHLRFCQDVQKYVK
jgi:hypothetical protein